MRLGVVLLGAKCSGKTSLSRAVLYCQSPELAVESAPTTDRPFTEHRAENLNILVAHATTDEQKESLARELARRTVRVALVAVPRNAPNTAEARLWSNFARKNCPNAYVGIVVTKNDLSNTAARAKSRYACLTGEQFLREQAFEKNVYDLMQTGGVEHLFYTSSSDRTGTEDLRRWISDMCASEEPLDGFGAANTMTGMEPRRKKKHRDQACAADCNTCVVQ